MRHPALAELFNRRLAIKQVAEACGISTAAVANWRTVPPDRAAKVAETLGVEVSAIPVTGPDARAA